MNENESASTLINETLWDVIAITRKTSRIRIIDTNKTYDNALAIVSMFHMRRGSKKEWCTQCRAGKYAEGSVWSSAGVSGMAQPAIQQLQEKHPMKMLGR